MLDTGIYTLGGNALFCWWRKFVLVEEVMVVGMVAVVVEMEGADVGRF
jgi:hypothetical protein